jgi:hypothetical protein
VETATGLGVDPEAAREGEPLAHALTGATIAMASWSLAHPAQSREQHALRLMNFAWTGLRGVLRGRSFEP